MGHSALFQGGILIEHFYDALPQAGHAFAVLADVQPGTFLGLRHPHRYEVVGKFQQNKRTAKGENAHDGERPQHEPKSGISVSTLLLTKPILLWQWNSFTPITRASFFSLKTVVMKTKSIIAPSFLLISLLCLSSASAQKETRWIGGHPGQETAWNCPQNWSGDRVPDEFSKVIIEDVPSTSLYHPVIRSGNVAVHSLVIESNSMLTVEAGSSLTVYTYFARPSARSLHLRGWMQVLNEHLVPSALALANK
jgi:hypothetical protein